MNLKYIPRSAAVTSIKSLNQNTRMFEFDVSVGAVPGQFVNIWLPGHDEKPFSVANDDGKTIKLAIASIGTFTHRLFELKAGDRVGIRGPYGNVFSVVENARAVLVGGGFGAAPLHFLGTGLKEKGCDVTVIIGAREKKLLMYLDECAEAGFSVIHTTNDGSSGETGFVTGPLARILKEEKIDIVQSCGPELMMKAVAELCASVSVDCEVSLERYMKCGFGICGQCACDGMLVCTDGTVFSGEAALRLHDFGKFHRDATGRKIAF